MNIPGNDDLLFLALGGAGEIGMNLNLYGTAGKWLMVDLGMTFADPYYPGIDLVFADLDFIEQRLDDLVGVVLTHAHEDHVGAVGHTYASLGAPIYTRVFTANIARRKLEEHGVAADAVTVMSAWPDQVALGPFKVGFLPISHSIPESSGLVIDTPEGRIVHTGDFKLDETPLVGEGWDPVLWGEIAKPGVKALVCDSTNVFFRIIKKSGLLKLMVDFIMDQA